jgi:hypothetical protein
LKSMFIKNNKYVVNYKLEHFDEISFRELFSRNQCFCLHNKICPFLTQSIFIYVGHSFLMKHSWTNSFNLSFSFELGIVV